MKIILIYPPTGSFSDYNTPTGLLYVATVLRKSGYNIVFVDCSVEPDYRKILKREVVDTDILGIYAMSVHIRHILPLVKELKLINDKMLIIWGGPHAILFPEQTAKSKYVDIACKGEGEEVMLEIVRGLESGNLELKSIEGIAYSENGKVYSNPYRDYIDMDTLPMLDWTFIKKEVMDKIRRTICRVQASRGCPYKCTFCINVLTHNQKMRYRKPKDVLDEIEYLVKNFGVKRIGFRDEVFMSDRNQVKEIAQGLIDRDLKITWIGNPRAEYLRERYIDDDYLQLIADSGGNKLQCGGESGSARILKFLKKGIKVKDIINFVIRTTKYNITPLVAFMTSLPTETKKEQKLTIKLIRGLLNYNPRTVINGPANFRPYPGGELFSMCVNKYNLKIPQTLEGWAKMKILGGIKPPWVKRLYFNMYIWDSIKSATYTKEMIRAEIKNKPIVGRLVQILAIISRFRLKHLAYGFPIEFYLHYLYDIYIAKNFPHYS